MARWDDDKPAVAPDWMERWARRWQLPYTTSIRSRPKPLQSRRYD